MKFTEFFEKHSKGVALFNLAIILFLFTCIPDIAVNFKQITDYQSALSEYEDNSDVEKDEFSQVENTKAYESTSVDTEKYEQEIKDLQEKISKSGDLEKTLNELIKNFMSARTGIRKPDKVEGIKADIKPYVTSECFDNYIVPFYQKYSNVTSVNWEPEEIKYTQLETDRPKAFMFVRKGITKQYEKLEFTQIEGTWYVDSVQDYKVGATLSNE